MPNDYDAVDCLESGFAIFLSGSMLRVTVFLNSVVIVVEDTYAKYWSRVR